MKKKYSIDARAKFHQERSHNNNTTHGKKIYSQQWLEGFHDPFAKNNYFAVTQEIKHKQKNKSLTRTESIMLTAYRNGCKARIDSGQPTD